MREFIYFSNTARTSGNFDDLMQAGRMDIVCHTVIASFFVSHAMRNDVKLHLLFNGPPDAPKHLEFVYDEEMPISKKDIAGLIKRMLFKSKKGIKIKAFPGCFIEKKSLIHLFEELQNEGKKIYLLDRRGTDIRETPIEENAVFVIGDQDGIPRREIKRVDDIKKISLGPNSLFASQAIVILNNELDRKSASNL
ncbi:MAG: tRNA (pseudouridine(54)-N(1))-methyltransferase TrmY [archaeon]